MRRSARSADTGLPRRSAGGSGCFFTWQTSRASTVSIVEEGLARQQPVADRTQRVEVAAGVNALRLFDRSGDMKCGVPTTALACIPAAGPTLHRLHQPEVEDLDEVAHAAPRSEDDIGRLDVAVDQADAMRLGEGAADLAQDDEMTRPSGWGPNWRTSWSRSMPPRYSMAK
jgi:hypothetical protein